MTTTQAATTSQTNVPVIEPAKQEMATIDVASLIVGRTLKSPIMDQNGVLLLAVGQLITGKFKDLLRARNITHVEVSADEVANITLGGASNAALQESAGASVFHFDTETTKQLDTIIESGALFVSNSGRAVKENMVLNGCKAYDTKERERLIAEHQEVSRGLDTMMQDAFHGKNVKADQLLASTAMYLSSMSNDAENVLTAAAEVSQDSNLADHCLRMSLVAMAIGVEMKLNAANVKDLGMCAMLHDWGMIRVPEAIRHADHVLSANEYFEIQKHPIHALELLEKVSGIPSIVPLVCYQVHERPNGTGYPRGRKKAAIHPFARILCVADSYVALTCKRPYRNALMPYSAMECLLRHTKDRSLDPDVVRALLHVNSLFPIGSYVTLSDSSVARVLRRNGDDYARPIVQLVVNGNGALYPKSEEAPIIDLSKTELRVVQALPTPGKDEIALNPDVLIVQRR